MPSASGPHTCMRPGEAPMPPASDTCSCMRPCVPRVWCNDLHRTYKVNPARCELHLSSVPARSDRTIVSAHRRATGPPPVPSGRSVAPADARHGEAARPGASDAARAGGHLPAGPGPAQGEHAGARVLHGDQAQVQAGHPVARHAARPAAGAACLEGNSCGAGSRHIGARNAGRHACFVCTVSSEQLAGALHWVEVRGLGWPSVLCLGLSPPDAPARGWRPACVLRILLSALYAGMIAMSKVGCARSGPIR